VLCASGHSWGVCVGTSNGMMGQSFHSRSRP